MSLPPTEITVMVPLNGAVLHASATWGPNWENFRWFADSGHSYLVAFADEGVTWVRGHLPFDAPEVQAMQSAFALSDYVSGSMMIRGLGR